MWPTLAPTSSTGTGLIFGGTVAYQSGFLPGRTPFRRTPLQYQTADWTIVLGSFFPAGKTWAEARTYLDGMRSILINLDLQGDRELRFSQTLICFPSIPLGLPSASAANFTQPAISTPINFKRARTSVALYGTDALILNVRKVKFTSGMRGEACYNEHDPTEPRAATCEIISAGNTQVDPPEVPGTIGSPGIDLVRDIFSRDGSSPCNGG